jgi:hypothetical protein
MQHVGLMNKPGATISMLLIISVLIITSCKASREMSRLPVSKATGIAGLREKCIESDTIQNILISKTEAILTFQGDRYEVSLSLYSEKDSVIYLTAVSSGFEVLRASADKDIVMLIDRLNRVVYRMPLNKMFGYQHPVSFRDLENIVHGIYLCNDLEIARETGEGNILFEFDEPWIRKRILISDDEGRMEKFEFFHEKTGEYLMGESLQDGNRIYSNFVVGEFEIRAGKGEKSFNTALEVDMDVNPRRYTFIDLQ